uniref:Fibronectin type-III domain-containing protein n=1 Tax=Macrostomum lignano TaxID=282301 RepID=A0A1I8F7W3_9PLAT
IRTLAWDRLLLTWSPGFDGGLPTRLQVLGRGWNSTAGRVSSFELWANISLGRMELGQLHPDTTYSISVTPVNALGKGLAYEGVGAPLVATTAHLRLPAVDQPRWDRDSAVLRFLPGAGDCDVDSDGCYCARLQLRLSSATQIYRVSLCLKVRPDVCGSPYTTYA